MLTNRVIPCLDIDNGRVVKGVRFANLRDAGDPVEQARRYEQNGADELVMLDVSATTSGRKTALETVQAVRRVLSLPLSVGGGVRTIEHATALLRAGADKVGVNSAAVDNPGLLRQLAEQVGSQCVVLSIDAAQKLTGSGWEVVTASTRSHGPPELIAWARARSCFRALIRMARGPDMTHAFSARSANLHRCPSSRRAVPTAPRTCVKRSRPVPTRSLPLPSFTIRSQPPTQSNRNSGHSELRYAYDDSID